MVASFSNFDAVKVSIFDVGDSVSRVELQVELQAELQVELQAELQVELQAELHVELLVLPEVLPCSTTAHHNGVDR